MTWTGHPTRLMWLVPTKKCDKIFDDGDHLMKSSAIYLAMEYVILGITSICQNTHASSELGNITAGGIHYCK